MAIKIVRNKANYSLGLGSWYVNLGEEKKKRTALNGKESKKGNAQPGEKNLHPGRKGE